MHISIEKQQTVDTFSTSQYSDPVNWKVQNDLVFNNYPGSSSHIEKLFDAIGQQVCKSCYLKQYCWPLICQKVYLQIPNINYK